MNLTPMRSSLVLLLSLLTACQTVDIFEYTPPSPPGSAPINERVVRATFDEVWTALIGSVGQTFFAIDNFEKESGLLTLSFSTTPYSTAVDGGHLRRKFDDTAARQGQAFWSGVNVQASKVDFDGNYADWVEQYLSGVFEGRMNIVVRRESEQATRVTINCRFVIACVSLTGATASKTTWAWNSPELATQMVTDRKGDRVRRAFKSTGFVEKKILDQLETLFPGKVNDK